MSGIRTYGRLLKLGLNMKDQVWDQSEAVSLALSSHSHYTGVRTALKKSSQFLSRVIRVIWPFQESHTTHCPTVLPVGVHSQELATHPIFLWPSTSLLLLALCLLWGNFLLFLLGAHQVKYPHVVEGRKVPRGLKSTSYCDTSEEECYQIHFPCHGPHSSLHASLQSHRRAGNDSTVTSPNQGSTPSSPCIPLAFAAFSPSLSVSVSVSLSFLPAPLHIHTYIHRTQEDFASGKQYLSLCINWLDWEEYCWRG